MSRLVHFVYLQCCVCLAAECAAPLVHYDCYRRRSEPTCAALGAGSRGSPQEDGLCFHGCYCPEGRLRKGDQCIAPTDCLDCKIYPHLAYIVTIKLILSENLSYIKHHKVKVTIPTCDISRYLPRFGNAREVWIIRRWQLAFPRQLHLPRLQRQEWDRTP